MAAQLRVLRRRIRSVQSTKKITRAMELIATSRISRAQARVEAARPYAKEITKVLSALAGAAVSLDTPLLVERENPQRAGVLVVTSDRGMCGAYNANVIRAAEELQALLREQGKTPKLYVIGRKGLNFYRFRRREIAQSWTGFSEQPGYENAADAGNTLVSAFLAGSDDTDGGAGADGVEGVDELHVVYSEFRSMLSQVPTARRVAPLEVEYSAADSADTAESGESGGEGSSSGPLPSYDFEPEADILLANLLPKYINTRIFAALLEAAASESAARRQAMKAATDNANDMIQDLTREANQARQAQITQEISEIVGGAEALSTVGSDE
ncbi:MAG: F0F1 ATP synthase subunit gamma [Pseudonocardiaceae bacterium]|nr:F0F1 ATP synthase subunit gamma [Pseudonocardiaceae bacterium]